MMRVVVTGGSGRFGRWAISELIEHGYDVVNASRRPRADGVSEDGPRPMHDAPFREVELCDADTVARTLEGCDAVVHLGAIPHPWGHPDAEIFANNTQSTYNVLQAAAAGSARRVVLASSESVYGHSFAPRGTRPLYVPIDEEHPLRPSEAYSLSKEIDERTGAMFHRRDGLSVVVLRFLGLMQPGEAASMAREARATPDDDTSGITGYTDVRDAAVACRLALETPGLGYEVINIAAADSFSDEMTEEYVRRHCPGVEIRERIPGTGSAWSIARARRLLGYAPRHSWRD